MTDQTNQQDAVTCNDKANADEILREKLADALTPGYQVEFDPEEADQAGAFIEDALSEQDAAESGIDWMAAAAPALVPAANDDRG